MPQPLTTLSLMLDPDPRRTVLRPFAFDYPEGLEDGRSERMVEVAERVLAYPPEMAAALEAVLLEAMAKRIRDPERVFRRRYADLDAAIRAMSASAVQQLLLGAVFSQEFAFESAALFNPSIVVDPERSEPDGTTPFVLSLRGIGEGHISSVTFRTGRWRADGAVEVDAPSPLAVPPKIERAVDGGGARLICEDSADVSETVIFPVMPSQRQGVEDLRMVAFAEDDGTQRLIGTYTAFDGRSARGEILEGIDFRTFEMRPLSGAMSAYKGLALFPRRIGGRYAMLGRQDSERIWYLTSDDLHRWDEAVPIMASRHVWEWVQLGNCGSPIEIDEGWLVITHGVGPMRSYSIGACLLDRDDPTKLIARTPQPLLQSPAEERGGYVPNVVYSCGALVRGRDLLLPYAVGDRTTAFATGSVDAVLAAMEPG